MSNTKTEAQRLADELVHEATKRVCNVAMMPYSLPIDAAKELRRLDALCDERGRNLAKLIMLASEMQDMLDWLKTERDQPRAQLAKAVAEEREACALECESRQANGNRTHTHPDECAAAIRARSNT